MAEYFSRAHEYICEGWPATPEPQQAFALAWLNHLHHLADHGWAPTPQYADWELTEAEADQMIAAVETLLIDIRTPGFDQDDPATL